MQNAPHLSVRSVAVSVGKLKDYLPAALLVVGLAFALVAGFFITEGRFVDAAALFTGFLAAGLAAALETAFTALGAGFRPDEARVFERTGFFAADLRAVVLDAVGLAAAAFGALIFGAGFTAAAMTVTGAAGAGVAIGAGVCATATVLVFDSLVDFFMLNAPALCRVDGAMIGFDLRHTDMCDATETGARN